jgi:hypothetical protein
MHNRIKGQGVDGQTLRAWSGVHECGPRLFPPGLLIILTGLRALIEPLAWLFVARSLNESIDFWLRREY